MWRGSKRLGSCSLLKRSSSRSLSSRSTLRSSSLRSTRQSSLSPLDWSRGIHRDCGERSLGRKVLRSSSGGPRLPRSRKSKSPLPLPRPLPLKPPLLNEDGAGNGGGSEYVDPAEDGPSREDLRALPISSSRSGKSRLSLGGLGGGERRSPGEGSL